MKLPTPEEDFDHFVRNPTQWFMKAQTLKFAALDLFERFGTAFKEMDHLDGVPMDVAGPIFVRLEYYQPAGLLAGFALEVLIKANIVALFPGRLKIGMRRNDWADGRPINPHDLLALSKEAQIEVDDEEILSILTKFSTWKGRYPSSMNGTPMYGIQSEFENLCSTEWVNLAKRFELEYNAIRDQVHNNIKVGRP